MEYERAKQKLHSIGQESLLLYWDALSTNEKKELLKQIDRLDLTTLLAQQELLNKSEFLHSGPIESFLDYSLAGNAQHAMQGKQLIAEGRVGCILIAGGQGTRLHFDGPKGLFPITPITKKSLFQFFSEKVVAASKRVGRPLALAIMTSPLNDSITRDFFSSHQRFGLDETQLSFFCQSTLPFLDDLGNLFLETEKCIAEGPDGNGSCLSAFVKSGIWENWRAQGISYINSVLIDNPLADPFDAELIGFHHAKQTEVTIKCTARLDAAEKVGLLVKEAGHVRVVEYSELPENERAERLPDGTWKHTCTNISLFCWNMEFVNRTCHISLPLHRAYKKAFSLQKGPCMAWKFEKFIFDLLPFAHNVQALLYPRDRCFAPLKNATGADSPETVRKALQEEARRIFREVNGREPPEGPFELPPDLYYPPH